MPAGGRTARRATPRAAAPNGAGVRPRGGAPRGPRQDGARMSAGAGAAASIAASLTQEPRLLSSNLPVRITRIDATPLAIPLAQEFHWSGGAQEGANLVLYTLHTDEGVVGHGEAICEDPVAVASYATLMARHFVGHEPGEVEAILRS